MGCFVQAAPLRSLRLVTLLVLFACPVQALPARAAVDGGPYVLRLDRGDSLRIVRLEPATFGMIRYVRTDSIEGYLGWHKVRALTDAQGADIAEDVRDRRRAIGVDPLLYRREGSSELRRRHRSRREGRDFAIFEAGYFTTVSGRNPRSDDVIMVSTDIGVMRNLSRSLAVGGVLHLEADDDRTGFGIGLRGRRWLNNKFSVDGGAGLMFAGDDDRGHFKSGAFFGEAAINFGDHLQLAARIESWRFERFVYGYSPLDSFPRLEWPPYNYVTGSPAERETLIHVGAKAGRYPGILLVVVVAFVALGLQSTRDVY
jgi:hypothetical protein